MKAITDECQKKTVMILSDEKLKSKRISLP